MRTLTRRIDCGSCGKKAVLTVHSEVWADMLADRREARKNKRQKPYESCDRCDALDYAAECEQLAGAETGGGREAELDARYHRTYGGG